MGGQNSPLAFLFLFLLTLLPCKGWAESWTDPSGSGLVLEYTEASEGVTITKITNAPFTLVIPNKIGEKSVVAIGASAYSEDTKVSLVLPASIKNIDNKAFADKKLSYVTMEGSTPCTLGTSAFGVQSDYFKIYIPSGSKAAYSEDTSWSDYADNLEELITDETGNLRFKEYKEGELYLAGFVPGKSAESITIPAMITVNGQELPVTGTYSSAFTSKNISSVTFAKDSQLKVIGQGAFSQTSLTKVTIPASVTKMEAMAFGSCNSLTTVIMESDAPCTLTYAPFRGCSSDLKIYVPVGTVETYKSKSDWNEYKNQIFEMPTPPITDVTGTLLFEKNTDGDGLILKGFVDGKSATSITIPATVDVDGTAMPVKEIGESAFNGNRSLASVDFSEASNLTTISDYAFANTTGLQNVSIPASVTSIGKMAFMGSTVSEVNFPEEGNLELGSLSFAYTMVSELTIPKSVKKLADAAFGACSLLKTVNMESDEPCTLGAKAFCNAEDGTFDDGFNIYVPKDKVETYQSAWTSYQKYIGVKPATTITSGNLKYELNEDGENTVTLVKVENVDSSSDPISFPETFEKDGTTYTVTQIGKGEKIFTGTSSIYASADAIPNTVNTIGANAFDGVYFRDGAVIPASVKYIGDGAFVTHYSESNVGPSASSVTLKSESAFAVGEKIFGEQFEYEFSIFVSEDLLESFKTAKGWDTYKDYFISEFTENGLRYRKYQSQDGATLSLVGFDEESTVAKDKVVVPAEVNGVPVTYIEQNAFKGKTSLTSLDLSQATNLKVINHYAFMQTSLTEVVIPENVTTICTAAFGNISTLKKVTLYPTAITQYDQSGNPYWRDQFMGCSNLEDVWVPKGTKSTYLKLFDTMANKDQIIKEMDNSIIVGDYTYELNEDGENTVTLVKFTATDSWSENVNVPATFEKDGTTYTVTQIGNGEKINVSVYIRQAGANAIPNTVTKIGAHAFDHIRFVNGVIIPASVNSIGDAAFVNVWDDNSTTTSVLYSVTLKASEAFTVGEKIFGETSKLLKEHFSILTSSEEVANEFKQTSGWDTYKDYFITEIVKAGLRYRKNADGTALTLMGFDGDTQASLTVPTEVDGIPVTAIASKAFESQSNLKSLDLSQATNLTQIGESAFGATGLTEVVIPAQVKTLGYRAFGSISSLTKATFERKSDFGEDVVYGAAFLGSENLAEIYVPKGTKRDYTNIFENRIDNAEEKIKEIVKPISDGIYKYQLNDDGQTVTVVGIADGVTLKNEIWVFGNVDSYQVTGIAANVFAKMSGITHIHVPSSVSTIAANAFSGMTSGLKVTFDRTGDISRYSKEMFGTTEVSSINVPTEAYAEYYAQLTNDQEDQDKIEKPAYTLEITDNGEDGVTIEMEGKTYEAGKITYKRTFSQPGQYGTIALPFSVASSEWNEYFDAVYTVSGAESMGNGLSKLKFQEVDKNAALYAKDAYFVKLKDGVQDVTLTNAEKTQIVVDPMVNCPSVSYDGNDGTVTITPHASWQKVDGNGTQYYTFNADGTFGKSDYVVPFRMCLTIELSENSFIAGAPAFFSIELPGGATTGINGVAAEKAGKKAAIYIIDGKLVRANGDTKGLAKGVYIIGGKKMVIK